MFYWFQKQLLKKTPKRIANTKLPLHYHPIGSTRTNLVPCYFLRKKLEGKTPDKRKRIDDSGQTNVWKTQRKCINKKPFISV